nr:9432_t:CDS:10 [Entrophospora candida]
MDILQLKPYLKENETISPIENMLQGMKIYPDPYQSAAICDFEAEIDGKDKVRGVVKEAKQAALDYNQAIENNYPMSERYGSSSSSANDGKKLVPDDVKYSVGANYKLDLKVTCIMTSTIQSIESPSHLISTKLNSEDLDKPRAFLEYNLKTESNRLMLTLVPRFALNQIQTEVVFIIDRSGSMEGEPIKKAGQALELFVRSLPEDCYFNVVSFGSHHDSLFPKSQEYSQHSLDKAINLAKNLHADYGGTEIYHLIKWAFDDQLTNMTTALFLLTDDNIIIIITVLRIFTLGINDSVSHDLVESVARTGNGYAQFVTNNERMDKEISWVFTHPTNYFLTAKSSDGPITLPYSSVGPHGISKEECSFDDPMQELSDHDNNEKVKKKKVEKDAKERKKPKIEILLKFLVMMKDLNDECEICYDKAKKALTKFKDYNEENDKKVMDSVRKWMNDWIKE